MILLLGCVAQEPAPYRWVRGYDGETAEMAEAGFRWALSLMGASDVSLDWRGDEDGASVAVEGLDAAVQAEVDAELGDERARFGGADLGRFLMRSLYEPARYYALVDAPDRWEDVAEPRLTYTVTTSLLTTSPRRVHLPDRAGCVEDCGPLVLTVAEQPGAGKAPHGRPGERERVDVMPNGQQRFTVYDADGVRIAASEGPAGGPGRCMWCHEDHLMPGVPDQNPAVPGSISGARFARALDGLSGELASLRAMNPDVDWAHPEVHEQGELLAFTFLNPSAERLSREWGRDPDEVRDALTGLTPAVDAEFPDLGPLYARADVDAVLAPLWGEGWTPVGVAPSFR